MIIYDPNICETCSEPIVKGDAVRLLTARGGPMAVHERCTRVEVREGDEQRADELTSLGERHVRPAE